MAAGEDQTESVVRERLLVESGLEERGRGRPARDLGALGVEARIATQAVDRLVARGRDEPRAGPLGHAVLGPAIERDGERFLQHLLGQIEVAEEADQGGERARALVLVQGTDVHVAARSLDDRAATGRSAQSTGGVSMIGRTSIEPMRADGMRAPMAIAWSRSWASIM